MLIAKNSLYSIMLLKIIHFSSFYPLNVNDINILERQIFKYKLWVGIVFNHLKGLKIQ